jgi:hypothetical protein
MSSNQEMLRLQQLQLMGITSYFPRFALPGALPSEPRSWQVEVAPQPTQKPAAPTQPVLQEPVPIHERRPDFAIHQAEPPAVKAAVAQPGPSGKANRSQEIIEDVLSLHLLLIPIDASLCVLNQLPVLAKSQMQERQQKLLDNILLFLGKRDAAYHSVRTFRWPLPGMTAITSANAAKSSLMHFLEQFFQESPFGNLLVMGEQGAEWVHDAGKLQADNIPVQPSWQLLHTYSLDQMLTLPAIKREVWQHLLPLQARLQAN